MRTNDTAAYEQGYIYPPLLMTTSTRDDRVHPYHARAFSKRLDDIQNEMKSQNDRNCFEPNHNQNLHPNVKQFLEKTGSVFYCENIEGGHGGAADNKQRAFMDVSLPPLQRISR
jgi:prolyl oligopeptidase